MPPLSPRLISNARCAEARTIVRVTVVKSTARLLGEDGAVLGEGRAYLHLRAPRGERQPVTGTLSLDWWNEGTPRQLDLAEGPLLDLEVDADRLSGCVVGRIVRYRAVWPGVVEGGPTS